MEVFRICLSMFSGTLVASNFPGRWNKRDESVIYTASSRSLACLENIVHRSGAELSTSQFSVLSIDVPDIIKVREVGVLTQKWRENQEITQEIGSLWYKGKECCILKVPSSIIPQEFNYVINVKHDDFNKITIKSTTPFEFDKRLQR